MDHISPIQIISAVIFGMIAAYLAHRNKKNPYIWFFVGFFFGLIGLFFLFFLPKIKKQQQHPDPGPLFRGPSDKLWFYLDPTHEQVGPVSFKAITEALIKGTISKSTYVWHEDLSEWKRVKEFIQ